MDHRTGIWDIIKVRHLSIESDADYILGLKMTHRHKETYIQGYSKDGKYSSQNGYKLLENLPENRENRGPTLSDRKKLIGEVM